jgi:hypothetical protein
MDAQQDILWIFNFLYLWIVFFLVWQPLFGASEVAVPEMDPPGKSFHEKLEESNQKQKKP